MREEEKERWREGGREGRDVPTMRVLFLCGSDLNGSYIPGVTHRKIERPRSFLTLQDGAQPG